MNHHPKSQPQINLTQGLVIGGKYRLEQQIGFGGMNSVIWKAKLLKINNLYEANFQQYRAIKIINLAVNNDQKNQKTIKRDELINNINREISVTQRAQHKSKQFFCAIYEWFWLVEEGEEKRLFCIVMELVNGITLKSYLDNKGMIPLVEAMDIYEKILLAIQSLHQMNQDFAEVILHRDLKLENVMLTDDFSRIKIIDFGVATVVDNSSLRSLKIDDNFIYGSRGYLPPDVVRNFNQNLTKQQKAVIINEFWDIFAAANILYRLLTSEPPYYDFKSDQNNDIYFKPEHYDFQTVSTYVPQTSPIIENIIYRSLVSMPNEKHLRYQSVDQVLKDVALWKKHPYDSGIKIIKTDSERKIEKIDKLLTLEPKYEISSCLWLRSFINYWIINLVFLATMLIICLI